MKKEVEEYNRNEWLQVLFVNGLHVKVMLHG